MVRFLKSSSITDQSYPWDNSSCSDSSSRATTKTKTNRTNVAPLFDRISGAEEASNSILFPNGEGGSSNTTTTTTTPTTTNNTDTTKALPNDMNIPKLTVVQQAANNELVEDSFLSTTDLDDGASDSVGDSFYNQLMQTWEHTDKVLTQDIPIAVSTTLHHTHKQIRDSINESFNAGLGTLLDKDRSTDFLNYDPDCVSSTQLDQLKKTIPSQSFLVGACLPRGSYLPSDIALMRQSSLQEIKRQSSKSIPSYKPSQKVSTSNQHPAKTNTMTKLPSQNYEISATDEDVQHNATQNLLTLISKTFDFTGDDDDLSVQQKEMVEQEMKKMEEMEKIWPMSEEKEEEVREEVQEEEGHEHGYVRRCGSFITPPIVNSTIDNDNNNDNDSDSDSDNDETIQSYYAMTLSSQSLLKRSSSPKVRKGKSKRNRNKNREQKKKSLFQNIDTFLSNKKKKEKQRRRRKLPSFVSSFWTTTTSAGPKVQPRTVAASSQKQEQEQRDVDVYVHTDNNNVMNNIDEERDESAVLEVAEISSLPSSASSSAISALSYLEDDNEEERGITFVYHDSENEMSSYFGDMANTDAVDNNNNNNEGEEEREREFEGDNNVDREIQWGDPGLEVYAYNNDEDDDDVEERDDVADVESSSVSSTFVTEDGGMDKKKGGTRGTGGGGSSALVSSTFVAEDDVDKKKGGTRGTGGGGSSALVYDQDHNATNDDSEEVVTLDVDSDSDTDTESTNSVEQNSVKRGEDFARYGIENRSVNQIRKIQYRMRG